MRAMEWKNNEKLENRVIWKSSNEERLFEEKRINLKREIGFTLSKDGITREDQIQIFTQIPFFMPVIGQVMLD